MNFFTSCLLLKLLSGFPDFSGTRLMSVFNKNRSWIKALSALLGMGREGTERESE